MTMEQELKNKVAVVTGGGGGIGSATVKALVERGAKVAIFDIADELSTALVEELRSRQATVRYDHVDVSDLAAVESACKRVEDEFGGIDILVNVAGGGLPLTIKGMSAADWQRVVGLNLSGPFNCIKACAEAMKRRGGGAIVTVGSLASITMSMNNGVSYTAAKSGVLGLTRHAAFELGNDKIRVNAVLPGPILTPQLKRKVSREILESVPMQLPLGRWIEPEEVASAILFFCLPASIACTGAHLLVDGGLAIGAPVKRDTYFKNRDKATV
jgi:NAD(P)-dependent dehydrogenase (short-subunit alcohol dehydrogenase family)